tara:strand:+ start:4687 stop:4869 length:183 start_codon:yes stop_codon:yes gene_type:complete
MAKNEMMSMRKNIIRVLRHEMLHLRRKFKSMEQDGGRYNTAADVLQERIDELCNGYQEWR